MEINYIVKNYSGKEKSAKKEEGVKKGRSLFRLAQDLENKDLQDQAKCVYIRANKFIFFKHSPLTNKTRCVQEITIILSKQNNIPA